MEKIRLDMAIRIFCHAADEDPGHRAACRTYLEKRYRAAARSLVETGDVRGLRCLLKEGWLSENDVEELLLTAVRRGQTDCVGLLLGTVDRQAKVDTGHGRTEIDPGGIKPTETTSTGVNPAETERLEMRILFYMGRELDRRFPYLGRTMHLLQADMESPVSFCGTDGFVLYVEKKALVAEFYRDSEVCLRRIAHSLVHAVSGHPLRAGISGEHVLAGFVCTNREDLADQLRYLYKTVGSCLSAFDSYLLLRGLKTLAVRMERQQQNALQIAQWLKKQPQVTDVLYIGLPEHPGYEVNLSQSRGFGSMISFHVDSKETAIRILDGVKLITYAESLGGTESLITYPRLQTHADVPEDIRERLGINDRLLRFSVGLEDVEDLITDLKQAF